MIFIRKTGDLFSRVFKINRNIPYDHVPHTHFFMFFFSSCVPCQKNLSRVLSRDDSFVIFFKMFSINGIIINDIKIYAVAGVYPF